MKVILQREVDKLGVPGDVIEVADGYARNFLIPKGLAASASKGAVKHAERLREAHEKRQRAAVEAAQVIADRLNSTPVRIQAKAGEDGRLFGSITIHRLADEIEKIAGAEIDRKQIHLEEPIRSVGAHEVAVHLHAQVDATVAVQIVAK